MSKELGLKGLIVFLAITLSSLVLVKPRIDNEYHSDYLQNLNTFDAISEQLTQDLLRAYLGLDLHYDFVEADLQIMQKSYELVQLPPGFVSENYKAEASSLTKRFQERYEQIVQKVNLAKSYIGLVRNSGRSKDFYFNSILQAAESDAAVLNGLHQLQSLFKQHASEQAVLSHIASLEGINPALDSDLKNLSVQAGMYSLYMPKLDSVIEEVNGLLAAIDEPAVVLALYTEQAALTVTRTDQILWGTYIIGALLVLVSLMLVRASHSARKVTEQKSRLIEESNEKNKLAISVCSEVLEGIAKGDFSRRVDQPFEGELENLRSRVNRTADRVESTMCELSRVMDALADGNFGVELDKSVKGNFRTSVEHMLLSLNSTFNGISQTMEKISEGDFSSRCHVEAQGDIGRLKEAVNCSLDSLEASLQEITGVVVAQKDGDLSPRVVNEYPGELHTLSNAVNVSMEKIQQVLGQIATVILSVESASQEISHGNTDLNNRTIQAVSHLEQASENIKNMTEGLKDIALCVSKAERLAESTSEMATRGKAVVADAVNAMSQIEGSSRKVVDIIGVIDEIAFQTNLLALNASVEAARAGD